MNIKFGMDKLGYGSAYMSNNLGSVFVIMVVTALLLLLSLCLTPCKHEKVQSLNGWIKKNIMWNFVIRLIVEAYLELTFSVYFNFKYASCNFNYFGSILNYFFAILFACLLIITPFFIIFFYNWHFYKFTDEVFEAKFGTIYDGLRKDRKMVIWYTAYFVVRRAAFAMASVLLYKYPVLQLEVSMLITLAAACFILIADPFDEPLLNKLEVMTECFTLLLLMIVFAFTDMFYDRKFQYSIGFLFAIVMCLCIGIHLFFLTRDMVKDMIRSFRRKYLSTSRKQRGFKAAVIRMFCSKKKEEESVPDQSDPPARPEPKATTIKNNEKTSTPVLE
jgi:hypothetical protein